MKSPSNTIIIFALLSSFFWAIQAVWNTPVEWLGLNIPIGHVIELALTFTITLLSYSAIVYSYLRLNSNRSPVLVPMMFSVLTIGLFGLGNGIHFAANSIHHFAMLGEVQGQTLTAVSLYDDVISHWIWGLAWLMFPLSIFLWQHNLPSEEVRSTKRHILVFASVWFGWILAGGLLEGKIADVLALPFTIVVLIGMGVSIAQTKRKSQILTSPGYTFSFIAYATLLLIVLAWGLIFQGFPKPLSIL